MRSCSCAAGAPGEVLGAVDSLSTAEANDAGEGVDPVEIVLERNTSCCQSFA